MIINNNRAMFHLWWKENLAKHEKVSKNYENDCQQNFILLLMSLLRAAIVKKCHFLARTYFYLSKTCPRKLENLVISHLDFSEKTGKAVTM